jgi:ProP effector
MSETIITPTIESANTADSVEAPAAVLENSEIQESTDNLPNPDNKETDSVELSPAEKQRAAKRKKREQNIAAMDQLMKTYPEIFNLKNPRPIKIGIHDEVATDEDLSKTKARRALATYVRQTAYLKAIVADAKRINIKGEEDGVVTEDEVKHAQEILEQRFKNRKPRTAQNKKAPSKKAAAPRVEKPKKAPKPETSTQATPSNEPKLSAEERMSSKLEQLLALKGKK